MAETHIISVTITTQTALAGRKSRQSQNAENSGSSATRNLSAHQGSTSATRRAIQAGNIIVDSSRCTVENVEEFSQTVGASDVSSISVPKFCSAASSTLRLESRYPTRVAGTRRLCRFRQSTPLGTIAASASASETKCPFPLHKQFPNPHGLAIRPKSRRCSVRLPAAGGRVRFAETWIAGIPALLMCIAAPHPICAATWPALKS